METSVEGSNPSPSATANRNLGSIMTERYFLWTVGCQMNVADSEKLAAGFTRLGMEAVPEAGSADIVVINTCSVRQHAEDRAYSQLGRIRLIKEERPDLKVAVMGCMVGQRTTDLEKRFPFVDVFARPAAVRTHHGVGRGAR